MKIEWQEIDIQAGRRVGHPERIEQWMIGYKADAAAGEASRWTLISLSDGMVQPSMTKAILADYLNKTGDLPVELLPAASKQQKGGRARAANMSAERRSEIASAAANARWNGSPEA